MFLGDLAARGGGHTAPTAPVASRTRTAPLAYIASRPTADRRAARLRKDSELAGVLRTFGFHCHVSSSATDLPAGGDSEQALGRAALVVCDLVRPTEDLPVEVAVAAANDVPVLVLVPAAVALDGMAREILAGCRCQIVRYQGIAPHHALEAELARWRFDERDLR